MYDIRLIWVGKTQDSYLKEGLQVYLKKLKPYAKVEVLELKPANYASLPIEECQRQETLKIIEKLSDQETSIFLDEEGAEKTSQKFSHMLDQLREQESHRVTLVIGGAFGFDKSLIPRQSRRIRLSSMTFTHQMIRLLLLEQIYRAFTIIHGQKYHH